MEDDLEWVPEEDSPSAEDIDRCAAVLLRLTSSDLELPQYRAIYDAGVPLFRRLILKDKFGSNGLQASSKASIYKEKAKLERLYKVVDAENEARRQKAETCGMNLERKKTLARVIAESSLPEPEPEEPQLSLTDGTVPAEALSVYKEAARPTRESLRMGLGKADPSSTKAADAEGSRVTSLLEAPRDNFFLQCNICRGEYLEHHHFYHQLCPRCAEHNWEKRQQTAGMAGMVCVVTGGRVRIGYATVLKLLRAGAFVLTTTRFPNDCALRYSRESDYEEWRDRLEVCGPLDLCDMRLVERFCDQLAFRFPRIHVLINNAAQTLTRREGWHARMLELECGAAAGLTQQARALLRLPNQLALAPAEEDALVPAVRPAAASEIVPLPEANVMWHEASQLEDFPGGGLDESRQPLDLSAANSWSQRLGDISTLELLQTLAANAAAPFIMCSRLAAVLGPSDDGDLYGHVINVSALEGKFSVKNKSPGHPHTNMAKAALNMMTHTSCKDLFRRRVLMNCVDTGWVTDMAPCGVGVKASTCETWVGPPLDEEDGAARVLDPVFSHLLDPKWLVRGKFFKNYFVCGW